MITTDTSWADGMTVEEAKVALATKTLDGAVCPCCKQVAKVYRRKLNSGMARMLIGLFRACRASVWVHVSELRHIDVSGDYAKLEHWGLIEAQTGMRDDGNPHTGYWRVTERGQRFVMNEMNVMKYVHLYNNILVDTSGPYVDIRGALGDDFNYEELMGYGGRVDDQ